MVGVEESHPVDVHVGQMVRILRKRAGLSQTQLAEAVGLTFQQIQKYERGANRVSASKLWDMAKFLGVPVSRFFEGLDGLDGQAPADADGDLFTFLSTPEGLEIARLFATVPSPSVRKKAVALIKALAES